MTPGCVEARRQPERRRADQLGVEVAVAATSGASASRCASGAFGSAPCASSAATIFSSRRMIAACSAVKPAAAGVRVGALVEQELDQVARSPECAASAVALTPQASASFTFAPAATSSFADARSPTRAANISAVSPPCGIVRLYSRHAVRRHGHHLAPDLRARVHVGAVREQHLDDVRMLLRDGPHQRRLAARAARVDVGALREQLLDDVGVARARGDHQRRLAGEQRQRSDSAPACSSRRTIAALPFRLAVQSGVAPRSLAALTLAPARISRSALSRSSR